MKNFTNEIKKEYNEQVENFKKRDAAGQVVTVLVLVILTIASAALLPVILGGVVGILSSGFMCILIDICICYLLFTGFWYGKIKGISRRLLSIIFICAWTLSAFGSGLNFLAVFIFGAIWYFHTRNVEITQNNKKDSTL